ncbi:MAG: hypothetical protein H7293_09490 [Candidatus Saccharibacteria bacterium]|nr:hypothetical protein [Rhodoferax sp.]
MVDSEVGGGHSRTLPPTSLGLLAVVASMSTLAIGLAAGSPFLSLVQAPSASAPGTRPFVAQRLGPDGLCVKVACMAGGAFLWCAV